MTKVKIKHVCINVKQNEARKIIGFRKEDKNSMPVVENRDI